MTSFRILRRGLIAATILALGAGGVAALTPQEVVVVVNAAAEGSVALGKYYCLARNILPERMVVLRTTADPLVSRKEYNDGIRGPLRRFMIDNGLKDSIKCLVLMWGVPVRVLGTKMSPGQKELLSAYKRLSRRLHGRLMVNAKLLGTVGEVFPAPRGQTLRPVGYLFPSDAAAQLDKSESFSSTASHFAAELKRKQAAVAKIKDAGKRRIALRQIAALRLSTYGPGNLLGNMPAESVSGVPSRDELKEQIRAAKAQRLGLHSRKETPETAGEAVDVVGRQIGLIGARNYAQARMKSIDTETEDASVDSELSLLWADDAPLRGWRPNPMCWRMGMLKTRPSNMPDSIVMTARIDGPSVQDALRIIEDSVATEKTGLKGTFYIDAGGKYPPYDANLKELARIVRKYTRIPVVLDTDKKLFPPGSCPDAALYVGWYSLRTYIPAFTWVRGAVGWHIASFEAHHLRAPNVNEWCVKMIQNGVAATAGATNEPYLHVFPLPQDFFGLLLTGHRTVAECWWRTVPYLSWRLTLIADPLYNPYKLHPQMSIYSLPPGLVGRKPTIAETRPATRPTIILRPLSEGGPSNRIPLRYGAPRNRRAHETTERQPR